MKTGIHLSIKAIREMDEDEIDRWRKLKHKEKAIGELEKGFSELLKKSSLGAFDLKVKVKIIKEDTP